MHGQDGAAAPEAVRGRRSVRPGARQWVSQRASPVEVVADTSRGAPQGGWGIEPRDCSSDRSEREGGAQAPSPTWLEGGSADPAAPTDRPCGCGPKPVRSSNATVRGADRSNGGADKFRPDGA